MRSPSELDVPCEVASDDGETGVSRGPDENRTVENNGDLDVKAHEYNEVAGVEKKLDADLFCDCEYDPLA